MKKKLKGENGTQGITKKEKPKKNRKTGTKDTY